MKVSLRQLESVLSKMKYQLLGYSSDGKDLVLDVDITKEDPGSGVMIDCITFKAIKPSSSEEVDSELRMEVEVYPEQDKIEPRASKIESFKITDKNKY
jgi:hypothetical protein